jgi:hypothetical protein
MSTTWQDIPDWLIYAVRWHHAAAMENGAERAGEEAVAHLTEKVLRDDPGFASVVVARYVRSLVRAPKQRRRGKPGDREKRMAQCSRMRAEGQSLRAIGERLGISHTTVSKLLAEWDTRLPEMPAELIRIASPLETPGVNLHADGFTPQVSADPNVIALRRPA